MGKVQILDKVVANQIAAGEVVERPASVIKELVENAIDAGATLIDIDIRQGGVEYIRVTDNGSGMNEQDAALAIERHATSKIRQAEDLLNIYSLGFRGEALPSIASVAKFRLVTRTIDNELATLLQVEGGKLNEVSSCGGNIGTSVFVEDLFFNIPARRKFLKTVATETRYINDIITKLALACPEVKFTLSNNQKTSLKTAGNGELLDTIRSLFGAQVVSELYELNTEYQGVKVTGYISRPSFVKSNRSWQYAFINRRSIVSKIIYRAIDQAYQSKIERNTHPFAIINITLDPAKIDINVHPQKSEVKFSDESLVYKAVYTALSEALAYPLQAVETKPDTNTQPALDIYQAQAPRQSAKELQEQLKSPTTNSDQVMPRANLGTPKEPPTKIVAATNLSDTTKSAASNNTYTINPPKAQIAREDIWRSDFYDPSPSSVKYDIISPESIPDTIEPIVQVAQEVIESQTLPAEDNISSTVSDRFFASLANHEDDSLFTTETKQILPAYSIGQVHNMYIIAQADKSMYIIDQHAAHERIIYDKISQKNHSSEYMQVLLVPTFLPVLRQEADFIEEYKIQFADVGLDVDVVGNNTVRISSQPADILPGKLAEFFTYVLERLREYKNPDVADFKEALAHSIACKAAVKAGDRLTAVQMQEIVTELFKTRHPFTCPHGRPIIAEFSARELGKLFRRNV